MKEHPILFSAPMVRADLEDRKTMTRRGVKPQPELVEVSNDVPFGKAGHHSSTGWVWRGEQLTELGEQGFLARCPYGQAGDRLWVKETFFAWGRWETRYSAKKGRDEWHFIDITLESGHSYCYAADGGQPTLLGGRRSAGITPTWWKRPAIFMPRAASRITLDVTGVRVERLQAISEADAIAEGIERDETHPELWKRGPLRGDIRPTPWTGFPKLAFQALWEGINGTDSWDANPWVWVVQFKRVLP